MIKIYKRMEQVLYGLHNIVSFTFSEKRRIQLLQTVTVKEVLFYAITVDRLGLKK